MERADLPFLELMVREEIQGYYRHTKNYEAFLDLYAEQDKLLERISSTDVPHKGAYYIKAADQYLSYRDYARAAHYYHKVLDDEDVITTYKQHARNGLGIVYRSVHEDFDQSDYWFNTLFDAEYAPIHEYLRENWEGIAMGNLGTNMFLRGELDKAIPLLKTGLEKVLTNHDYGFASGLTVRLADIYLRKGMTSTAKRYIDLTQEYHPQEIRAGRQAQIYEVLSKYYAATGQSERSILYMDSLQAENKRQAEEFNTIVQLRLEQRGMAAEMRQREFFSATKTVWMFLLPAFVSLFGAVTLLLVKRRSQDKARLALLLFMVSFFMILNFVSGLFTSGAADGIFRFIDSLVGLLLSPLVFYYFLTLFHPFKNHRRTLLYWYLPAITVLLWWVVMRIAGVEPMRSVHTWSDFVGYARHPEFWLRLLALLAFATQIPYCTYKVFKMRVKYRADLLNTQSSIKKIDLKWVNYVLAMLVLFGTVSMLNIVQVGLVWKFLFALVSTLCMFLVFIFGYWQMDIRPVIMQIEDAGEVPAGADLQSVASGTDYKSAPAGIIAERGDNTNAGDDTDTNGNSDTVKNALLLEKIDALMQSKQLYLDRNLKVQDLVDVLYTNRSYISVAINSQHRSFYDYVNKFRIKHAIDLLKNYDGNTNLTILAEQSGFQSYHVFSRLLSKTTGFSPREFVKRGAQE